MTTITNLAPIQAAIATAEGLEGLNLVDQDLQRTVAEAINATSERRDSVLPFKARASHKTRQTKNIPTYW